MFRPRSRRNGDPFSVVTAIAESENITTRLKYASFIMVTWKLRQYYSGPSKSC